MGGDAPTCPDDAAIAAMAGRHAANQQQPTPPAGLTMAGAPCGRDKFAKAGRAGADQRDLLSPGSFTRLLPPRPGLSATAVYEGLPGTPRAAVNFK